MNKSLAYALALQDWVEKASRNPSSRDMAQCVSEMWERMYGLIDFTLYLQALLVLDLTLGSKLRVAPKAVPETMPQPKEEDQSPMCGRGERLRRQIQPPQVGHSYTYSVESPGCQAASGAALYHLYTKRF